jgi:hypothetical protein
MYIQDLLAQNLMKYFHWRQARRILIRADTAEAVLVFGPVMPYIMGISSASVSAGCQNLTTCKTGKHI